MAWFTVIIAIATIANVYIIDRQLKEMRSSGVDTHNLAIAARAQATATANLRGASEEQAHAANAEALAMDKLRLAGEAQARSMESLRVAGTVQAGAMLKETQVASEANRIATNANYATNRPWIGLGDIDNSRLTENQPLHASIFLTNSGRSPALHVKPIVFIGVVESAHFNIDELPDCTRIHCTESTVLPNSGLTFRLTLRASDATKQNIDSVNSGKSMIIIYFRAEYRDSDSHQHATTGCEFYVVATDTFSACQKGNDAD
jgi:hypothetical protein